MASLTNISRPSRRSRTPRAEPQPRQELLRAMLAVRDGDFSVRLATDEPGLDGKLADAFNEIVFANARMAAELERVGRTVGRAGRTRERADWRPLGGAWASMQSSLNTLIDDLVWPTERVTRSISAVAKGAQ